MQHNATPPTSKVETVQHLSAHTNPKRIAICSVGELFGGVERHILGLLTGLKAKNIAPLLILFHDGELALQAREQGLDPTILPPNNAALVTTSRLLARILQERKAQLVHVHGYKATVFCGFARQWHLLPIIKTEHGLPESMGTSPVGALRNRLYHGLDCIATRAAVDCVSYVAGDLQEHYKHEHRKLPTVVIPNGVAGMSRAQFPRPPELQTGNINLVIAGRLDTVKGHHLAIHAMSAPSLAPTVHLYIIGTGPCAASLRVLAKTRDLTDRVHFLGFRRNIYDYIAHCDMLLMPSLHEGLPYTLLEAMALGTPIIASQVGGLAEVVKDGVTGLLLPPGDAASLAEAVARLCWDLELRRSLGDNARAIQRAQYSLDAMTERYLAIYYQALTTRP